MRLDETFTTTATVDHAVVEPSKFYPGENNLMIVFLDTENKKYYYRRRLADSQRRFLIKDLENLGYNCSGSILEEIVERLNAEKPAARLDVGRYINILPKEVGK